MPSTVGSVLRPPPCQDSNQHEPPRGFQHVLQYEITALPLPLTVCSCPAAALDASRPRAAQPCIDPTGLAAVFGIATANIQPGTRHHMMASPPASAAGMLASASAMTPSAPGSAATHSHRNFHTSSTFSNLGLAPEVVEVCVTPASAMSSSEESSAAAPALYCLCPVRVETRCMRLHGADVSSRRTHIIRRERFSPEAVPSSGRKGWYAQPFTVSSPAVNVATSEPSVRSYTLKRPSLPPAHVQLESLWTPPELRHLINSMQLQSKIMTPTAHPTLRLHISPVARWRPPGSMLNCTR
jgi:hypothetical protein